MERRRHTIFHFGPDERAAFIAILRYYRDHSGANAPDKSFYDEMIRKFSDQGGGFLSQMEMDILRIALNSVTLELQEKLKRRN